MRTFKSRAPIYQKALGGRDAIWISCNGIQNKWYYRLKEQCGGKLEGFSGRLESVAFFKEKEFLGQGNCKQIVRHNWGLKSRSITTSN